MLRKRPAALWMIGFTVLLAVMGLRNAPLFFKPVRSLAHGEISFSEFTETVQENYTNSLHEKYSFVNFSGWLARRLDQSVCNEVFLLKNGMLGRISKLPEDPTGNAESMAEFSRFLEVRGIPFLFIQAPTKMDLNCELLPEGFYNFYNAYAGELIALLEEKDVRVLDLRATIAGTPVLVEQNYFRTDHHWTYTGALYALQYILPELESALPDAELDFSRAAFSEWEEHILKDRYMGSQGRRVGIYFAGVDDFVYYTPKRMDMARISRAIPSRGEFAKGDFTDAILLERLFDNRDYFVSSIYYLYVGGDYPLIQLRNPDAPNDLKVLFIKNSFAAPILGYASVLFQEVDIIDPRCYTGSIAQYVLFFQPDIVIQLMNPQMDEICYAYGLETISADVQNFVFEMETVHAGGVPIKLKPGQAYVLTFEDVELDGSAAMVVLYDDGGQLVDSAIFDIEYCRENGGFSALLNVPDGAGREFELHFYSGASIIADDGSATYRSVQLESFDPA